MTNEQLEQVYLQHKDEAVSLAVRKWGYTHDHAEDAVQQAALYLLAHWRKATPPGRTAFIQNVRQQCVNLMGKNEGRSISRGTPRRVFPVGGEAELAVAERVRSEREHGRRAYTGKARSVGRQGTAGGDELGE